tara:strand:- start:11170 stop:11523 length:354 start_codon:yes stop_codon:yes gene_type:complete
MSKYPSPQNNNRSCLCPDGSYSTNCCDGSLQAQGIGNITGHITEDANYYKVQRCGHNMKKEVHLHDRTLIVGNVYYLNFENTGHSNCYTVLSEVPSGEHHIDSETVYADCDACIADN